MLQDSFTAEFLWMLCPWLVIVFLVARNRAADKLSFEGFFIQRDREVCSEKVHDREKFLPQNTVLHIACYLAPKL